MYGMIQRSERGAVTYNFGPYMFSHGGAVYKDLRMEFLVSFSTAKTIEKPWRNIRKSETRLAIPMLTLGQGEMIQYLRTGKAAHAIAIVTLGRNG